MMHRHDIIIGGHIETFNAAPTVTSLAYHKLVSGFNMLRMAHTKHRMIISMSLLDRINL